MSNEERFSGKHGLVGCLVTWACMFVFALPFSLVFTSWLGLISVESEGVILIFIWLFAVGLGGYAAARLGKSTGWTNSLVVGVLAEFFIFARLPKGKMDQTSFDPFLEIIQDPVAHWPRPLHLSLTIPAAILGGVIWQSTGGASSSGKGQSELPSESEGGQQS